MTVENATYIHQLDPNNPTGTATRREGDNHLVLLKRTLRNTFPNVQGAANPSHTELNFLVGLQEAVQAAITELRAGVAASERIANKGASNGYAALDANTLVPLAQIPTALTGKDADLLDGQHGAYYRDASNLNAGVMPAARFTNTTHGQRSGGDLHSVATSGAAGFMSAADKAKIDTMESGATADEIPQGSVMVFHQSAAPAGWTKITTVDDRMLRVTSGTGGSQGGGWSITGLGRGSLSVSGHALSLSEMPPHNHGSAGNHSHTVQGTTSPDPTGPTTGFPYLDNQDPAGTPSTSTAGAHTHATQGSGASHSHGLSGAPSQDGNWRPAYTNVILCSKND